MTYEKIIVKENGDKVKIRIYFYIKSLSTPTYQIQSVSLCPKGKRTFKTIEFDSYNYRLLSNEERIVYELNIYLQYISQDDINSAKLELWQKLMP